MNIWIFPVDKDNNTILWKYLSGETIFDSLILFIISTYKMTLASSTLSFLFFVGIFSVVSFIASIVIVPLLTLSFIFSGFVVVFNGLSYVSFRVASSEYNHTVLFLNRLLRNLADNLPPSVGIVEVESSYKSVKSIDVLALDSEPVEDQKFTIKSIIERYIAKARYFPLLISRREKKDESTSDETGVEAVVKQFEGPEEPQSTVYVVDEELDVIPSGMKQAIHSEETPDSSVYTEEALTTFATELDVNDTVQLADVVSEQLVDIPDFTVSEEKNELKENHIG